MVGDGNTITNRTITTTIDHDPTKWEEVRFRVDVLNGQTQSMKNLW